MPRILSLLPRPTPRTLPHTEKATTYTEPRALRSRGLGNICIVPYNCDYEKTGSRGLSSKPNPLARTWHDNLQRRHDWTGLVMGRTDAVPSSQCLMELRVQSMQLIHNDIAFCLKLIQNRRMVQWLKKRIYIYTYNTLDMLQWMRELKPSFATLSTFWSARQKTNLIWQVSNWFLVITMIRLLFILLLPGFHWLYVFR